MPISIRGLFGDNQDLAFEMCSSHEVRLPVHQIHNGRTVESHDRVANWTSVT